MPTDTARVEGSTKVKWKSLRSVFDGRDEELDACVARICVLFEDLRLELDEAGLSETTAPRRNYFVRRSIATLREFTEGLLRLNGLSGFQRVLQRLDTSHRGEWNSSIARLGELKDRINRERNHYGGHFSHNAALSAVRRLEYGGSNALEIYWVTAKNTAGPRFHFAHEIANLALLSGNTTGESTRDYFTGLLEIAFDGYKQASICTNIVAAKYLAPRFGF
jgi:hypothetical protein